MSTEPLITTIIPTYRRPHLLQRAIRSVLDQTYPHFKICIYDNASNDETAEVISAMRSRDSRIHYHCHPENIGSQDNFIYGLSHADTPLVHLLSDDDFLLPEFFARATAALGKHPDAAFFSGGLLSANSDGSVRGLLRYGSDLPQAYCPPRLFQLMAPYTRTWTSALFRRTSLDALGGLKKETGYAFPIDLILRSATRYAAVLSDIPSAVFTVHSGSISVEEVSEAFASTLNLAFFDSINRAIDSAAKDNIVTKDDAGEMKAVLRATAEYNFFHGAFGLIARDQIPVAIEASEVLAAHFKRKDLAAVVKAAALDNGLGSILRIAIKGARTARGLWVRRNSTARYPAYSELVRNRMRQLTV
jgi:glycosyltransferase involved in cell wall biosynthesis